MSQIFFFTKTIKNKTYRNSGNPDKTRRTEASGILNNELGHGTFCREPNDLSPHSSEDCSLHWNENLLTNLQKTKTNKQKDLIKKYLLKIYCHCRSKINTTEKPYVHRVLQRFPPLDSLLCGLKGNLNRRRVIPVRRRATADAARRWNRNCIRLTNASVTVRRI